MQKTEKIWLDGKLIPWEQANVHILTHTLHYGVGVFEGIRYYDCGSEGSAVFRLRDHMKRFLESAKSVAMNVPYDLNKLCEACVETAKANQLKEGYLRPIAFISEGPGAGVWAFDNPVRVGVITWGWGKYLGDEGFKNGIKTMISSYTRLHRNISATKAKVCGQYANSVLAKRDAKVNGCDEALLLDTEGFVAEGTGENLFLVKDGIVYTPRLGSILPGFTRDVVMKLLKEDGIPFREEQLIRDDVYNADEIFLTGTAAEITPVREVDARPVGTGKPGPVTVNMAKQYIEIVHGRVAKYKEWLTYLR
ncbi:MAG: branched-chain amino acid transaminase [Pseudomonadota bacterium]